MKHSYPAIVRYRNYPAKVLNARANKAPPTEISQYRRQTSMHTEQASGKMKVRRTSNGEGTESFYLFVSICEIQAIILYVWHVLLGVDKVEGEGILGVVPRLPGIPVVVLVVSCIHSVGLRGLWSPDHSFLMITFAHNWVILYDGPFTHRFHNISLDKVVFLTRLGLNVGVEIFLPLASDDLSLTGSLQFTSVTRRNTWRSSTTSQAADRAVTEPGFGVRGDNRVGDYHMRGFLAAFWM